MKIKKKTDKHMRYGSSTLETEQSDYQQHIMSSKAPMKQRLFKKTEQVESMRNLKTTTQSKEEVMAYDDTKPGKS